MQGPGSQPRPFVAHLSSLHHPGHVRILHKECAALAHAGHDVFFIVPGGGPETMAGLDNPPPFLRVSGPKRPKSRLTRMFVTTWQVALQGLRTRAKVFHLHDPELIPPGFLLKLLGRKVVYDAHEDLPRAIRSKRYLPRFIRWPVALLAGAVELLGAMAFNAIVAATPAIARRFPQRKTVLVRNLPILAEFGHNNPLPFSERPVQAAYCGGITEIRGIREMVAATDLAQEDIPLRLALAGPFGPPTLLESAKQLAGWQYVDYSGVVDRSELPALLRRSRAGLLLYHPEPNHIEALPNKLFEYMAAGLPVIASDFPLWKEIISQAQCGVTVDPLDVEAVAKAMAAMISDPNAAEAMGQNGAEYATQHFAWEQEKEILLALYSRLTPPPQIASGR
ncbi:MAG: glycosyltransferase [Desulfovibrio sp.]|nr:MAG: glycosyltransferase [Desulfovibrio sp.]